MNPDLDRFVRDTLGRGLERERIRGALLQAGWPSEEIEAALAQWADLGLPIPVPRRRPYLSAREAFLYLVMFVTLYITAFDVGALLFQAVERWVPDPGRGANYDRYSPEQVRTAVAGVLIAFPIFLALARAIGREIGREPEKRASRIRKWLTYLTLFVAAIVLIGDLTWLVAKLLGGELPPRFLLKTIVVFAIAATVFGHYLADLRREEREGPGAPPTRTSPLARAAASGVILTLALGLVMAGSPRVERQRKLDRQRIEDLSQLSRTIESYFREFEALPATLDQLPQLRAPGFAEPFDPVNGRRYEYATIDSMRYRLCADFETADSTGGEPPTYPPDRSAAFWRHAAGRQCFELRVSRAALIAR